MGFLCACHPGSGWLPNEVLLAGSFDWGCGSIEARTHRPESGVPTSVPRSSQGDQTRPAGPPTRAPDTSLPTTRCGPAEPRPPNHTLLDIRDSLCVTPLGATAQVRTRQSRSHTPWARPRPTGSRGGSTVAIWNIKSRRRFQRLRTHLHPSTIIHGAFASAHQSVRNFAHTWRRCSDTESVRSS